MLTAATLIIVAAIAAHSVDGAEPSARPVRGIYDAYHPWTPPDDLASWQAERERLQQQVLVAAGLWPLPEKTQLTPVIHGLVDRGDYTIERVYFASRPGVYVTGSLYRPKGVSGRIPAVLSPHGHWPDGRFHDAGVAAAKQQREQGAEQFESGARYPLQARMVQLARMGCIVFHYDMLGYADQQPLDHRRGLNDVDSTLWLHGQLGLQLWNSIRALDFVCSLPDVDPLRIGVTGASGGGTQTFLLCAVDDRPTVAFPAVMVSTGMQGGCVCENAPYLRQGINNIALAALCAPRPMAMTGADDWTIDIETRGLPELRAVYALYGKSHLVTARTFSQFKHNYNQVSREMMFAWFQEHLHLDSARSSRQSDFWPLSRDEMTVFTTEHPVPSDALGADSLRTLLREEDQRRARSLLRDDSPESRHIFSTAARVMLSPARRVEWTTRHAAESSASQSRVQARELALDGEPVLVLIREPEDAPRRGTVYWFDERGAPALLQSAEVDELLAGGMRVVSAELPDRFRTQQLAQAIGDHDPALVYCYNRPLLAERARVIEGVVRATSVDEPSWLVGTGAAGMWTLSAGAILSPDASRRLLVEVRDFAFEQVTQTTDENLLPGIRKYGGLGCLVKLAGSSGALSLSGVGGHASEELEDLMSGGLGGLRGGNHSEHALSAADVVMRVLSSGQE